MEIIMALFVCYLLWLMWVRLSKKEFTVSGGKFRVQVICEGLYTKMFRNLIHKFVILYGFKNIEWPTQLSKSKEFLRPYIEHETTHYRAIIEVGRAIAMILNKLAVGFSNKHVANNYCVGQSMVWKYTFIVTHVLANPRNLYSHFVSVLKAKDWYR